MVQIPVGFTDSRANSLFLAIPATNIKVEVSGYENFSNKNGVFIFNHSSNFDIPVLFVALHTKTARFGAKSELFKIPFFGAAMKSIGVLEIHRGQREKVLELYKNSLTNLDKGMNYVLAPEGTRQYTAELGNFKSGPFIMAIAGQCPLLPVVITGAQNVMPKHSLFPSWGVWQSKIQVQILPEIPSEGLGLDQRIELSQKAKNIMSSALEVKS